MSQRHRDALHIQEGACNPIAIANALIRGCREVHEEGGNACSDAALRLMVHQLAFIMNISEVDNGVRYKELTDECAEQCLTVDEMAKRCRLSSYDTALPIAWVNAMKDAGFNPVGQVVWCYDDTGHFGVPYGLTVKARSELARVHELMVSK